MFAPNCGFLGKGGHPGASVTRYTGSVLTSLLQASSTKWRVTETPEGSAFAAGWVTGLGYPTPCLPGSGKGVEMVTVWVFTPRGSFRVPQPASDRLAHLTSPGSAVHLCVLLKRRT